MHHDDDVDVGAGGDGCVGDDLHHRWHCISESSFIVVIVVGGVVDGVIVMFGASVAHEGSCFLPL